MFKSTLSYPRHLSIITDNASYTCGQLVRYPRGVPDAFSQLLASLGANVRSARERCDLTQQELATLAGISQRYVAGIEAGRESPGLRCLFALAQALEMRPSSLLAPRTLRKRNPGRPRKSAGR